MYDVVLSCIQRIHKLQELPMDHEPSRDELWDFILQMDGILRLAVTNHPDFEKQLREVLSEWGTNDLVECCLDGGVVADSWVGTFAEQAESLEEYEPVKDVAFRIEKPGRHFELRPACPTSEDYCNGDAPNIPTGGCDD